MVVRFSDIPFNFYVKLRIRYIKATSNEPHSLRVDGNSVLSIHSWEPKPISPFFAGVFPSVRCRTDSAHLPKNCSGRAEQMRASIRGQLTFQPLQRNWGGRRKRVLVHFSCRGEGTLVQGHTGDDGQVGSIFGS